MTAPLAPCPFCGGAATVQPWRGLPVGYEMIEKVRCARCSAQSAPYADARYASEAWNRRAPALRWRSEPPDVPGWWWCEYRRGTPAISHYTQEQCSKRRAWPSTPDTRWAGPIAAPEDGGE